MSKTIKIAIGIVIIIFLIVILAPKKSNGPGVIKIGVIAPMTGNAATYGEQVKKGIDIALDRIRKDTNLNIKLIIEDNQFDPKMGLTAYNKLTKIDEVKYLITFGGNVCPIINPLAQKDKIVNFATGCNTLDFNDDFSYNFRFDVSESSASVALIEYAKNILNTNKLALLYVNNDWGTIVAKTIKDAAFKNSIEIIAEESFHENTSDIRTQIAKIKQSKPDSLFFVSLVSFTPPLLKQVRDGQTKANLLTNISIQGASPEALGNNANGVIYSAPKIEQVNSNRNIAFNTEFPDPDSRNFSSWGFDSLNLLADALVAEGDSPDRVAGYLHKVNKYAGAFGEISYDSHGELKLDYQIKQVKDGKFVKINN